MFSGVDVENSRMSMFEFGKVDYTYVVDVIVQILREKSMHCLLCGQMWRKKEAILPQNWWPLHMRMNTLR